MIFKPLSIAIGLRYTRAKQRNRFISFISLASIVGIALGIIVLITVLSVINGFDEQIRNRFFAIAPQITVLTGEDIAKTWPQLAQTVQHVSAVKGEAPFASGQGMLMSGEELHGVSLIGVLPQEEKKVSDLSAQVVAGNLSSLQPGSYHLMMGKTLAKNLGLNVGDTVNFFIAENSDEGAGLPQFNYQNFTLTALFSSSAGFGFEQVLAYANMADVESVFKPGERVNGLHVKIQNLYQAAMVSQKIQSLLPNNYFVTNWAEQSGSFFQTLAMQKSMLFMILLMIIAIAVFNLVSTLIMVVNEKRADIAIMRTLGATPMMIMNTFIAQGAIIGLVGTTIGLIGGLLLAANITHIVNGVQTFFHVQLISASVYFVNYLPSKIMFKDVWVVCAIAFGLSIIAAIYPALVAFHTEPAEALKYD
jgi:lipoprotein-releasing system permease protein